MTWRASSFCQIIETINLRDGAMASNQDMSLE